MVMFCFEDPTQKPIKFTSREVEIVRAVVFGMKDKEVGKLLGLSVRTVHVHLQNIYKKFRIHSRSALVRKAHETGIVKMKEAT